MVHIVTLSASELADNLNKLRAEMRLTKAIPKSVGLMGSLPGPPMVLVVTESSGTRPRDRRLAWIGVVARHNTVGTVDNSITVDPLRECMDTIPLDGAEGLLNQLPDELNRQLSEAASPGSVGICGSAVWDAINAALRSQYPNMADLLDWLLAQATPPIFDSNDPADRSWQEQRDATGCLLRIADFPLAALAAWQRPSSPDAPYLAGLIPQPYEQSLIDHDIRVAGNAFGLFSEWRAGHEVRCDIHVLRDTKGRRLEVVNVNTLPLEFRTGTDMIYYHEPTQSFVLVQYKRLDSRKRSMYVNERLRKQLDKLDEIANMSRNATKPTEWRIGRDACFLKLAYWLEGANKDHVDGLTPGMYLPVSYTRLLLEDDCTRGTGANSSARLLGYKQVERHLVNTQFVELVKHGWAGTVGVTVEELRDLVSSRADDGQSVVLAAESSPESAKERQARHQRRGAHPRSFAHVVTRRDGTA